MMIADARAAGGRLGVAVLGALVLSALAALAFQVVLATRLPRAHDREAVAHRIRAEARPGDEVLVVPMWAEAIRADLAGGPEVVALPASDPDLALAKRLWVVALAPLPHLGVTHTLAVLEKRFGKPDVRTKVGRLTLLRFTPPPRAPEWDLSDHLDAVTVSLGGAPCPPVPAGRRPARHQCKHAPWNYVGAGIHEIDYLPRRCIWAHPAAGLPLRITVPDAPYGNSVVVQAGIVGEAALDVGLTPVDIDVDAGGRRLGRAVAPGRPGWFETKIESNGVTGHGPLTFTITTRRPGRHHLCFDATIPLPEAAHGQ